MTAVDGVNARKHGWLGVEDSEAEDAENDSEQEEEGSRIKGRSSKRRKLGHVSSASEDNEGRDDEGDEVDEASECGEDDWGGEGGGGGGGGAGEEDIQEEASRRGKKGSKDDNLLITSSSKLKPLSKEELAASKEATAKTGVIYLSRIPPFMKPMKVKHLLSRFGEIGRIFLSPEDPKAYARRVRFGGNKKRNFDEGWVEFKSKKAAKLVAETLNASIIGGKKGSYYHDDVWNIKYLPKFKWHHLQAQIAYENASRQAKLRAEIAQATRENKTYIRNVERAKMEESMASSKKRKRKEALEASGERQAEQPEPIKVKRQFRQHRAKGKRVEEDEIGKGSSEKVKRLLGKIF